MNRLFSLLLYTAMGTMGIGAAIASVLLVDDIVPRTIGAAAGGGGATIAFSLVVVTLMRSPKSTASKQEAAQ